MKKLLFYLIFCTLFAYGEPPFEMYFNIRNYTYPCQKNAEGKCIFIFDYMFKPGILLKGHTAEISGDCWDFQTDYPLWVRDVKTGRPCPKSTESIQTCEAELIPVGKVDPRCKGNIGIIDSVNRAYYSFRPFEM